jgi:hypothetical protein
VSNFGHWFSRSEPYAIADVTTTTLSTTTPVIEIVTTTTTTIPAPTTAAISDEVVGEWNIISGENTGHEVVVSITDDVVTVQTFDSETGEMLSFEMGSFDAED